MKRGRLPLTALRSFEAAARRLSFTLAAQDLFVSQAAISRQVRELEMLVGQPLFSRGHRSIALTEAGERLMAVVGPSFDAMDAALEALAAAQGPVALSVSSDPTFAACWLVPQLADFCARHPIIEVTIDADPRLVTFRRGEPELAVRFSESRDAWPGAEARLLHGEALTPLVPVGLATDGLTPAHLARQTLLHADNRTDWARWFAAAGDGGAGEAFSTPLDRGTVYADTSLALQAAGLGQGVALADRLLAADAIAQGKVASPFATSVPGGRYFLMARRFAQLSPAAEAFAAWIMQRFSPVT
ncbi:transcriptional regulator [Rhizobium sp. RU20A]|uniref:LysR substrate-binding domain-containing protein n=1 Tax=Rhizobium sp. RU20A TaxID=1907412 RepID=UPI0009555880|nr:LysR substrate-binding domain-containing protein [Rhizobium sp. RU20A]SIR11021.1 transcriptional regulator [Rhizobium sp. RU20A]